MFRRLFNSLDGRHPLGEHWNEEHYRGLVGTDCWVFAWCGTLREWAVDNKEVLTSESLVDRIDKLISDV